MGTDTFVARPRPEGRADWQQNPFLPFVQMVVAVAIAAFCAWVIHLTIDWTGSYLLATVAALAAFVPLGMLGKKLVGSSNSW